MMSPGLPPVMLPGISSPEQDIKMPNAANDINLNALRIFIIFDILAMAVITDCEHGAFL